MSIKPVLLGTLAYTFVTFPIAIVWHIVFFESLYIHFGYFEGEPSFLLGLVTIFIQGIILSFLYPYVLFKGTRFIRALKYSLLMGIFFWTSHVLAFIAKQEMPSTLLFVGMESLYLFFQFGFYGLLLGLINSKQARCAQ